MGMMTPEEKMIKDMNEIALNNANRPPGDRMMELFNQCYPQFKVIIGGLGKQDLIQLADNLVKMPDGTEPKFYHPKTQLAAQLGALLLNCKSAVLLKANLETLMEAYERQKSEKVEELPTNLDKNIVTQTKENNNG